MSAAVLLTGCWSSPRTNDARPLSVGCDDSGLPLRLDRGDWLVSEGSEIWKVYEGQPGALPRQIGYLVGRDYRQMRGGRSHRMYTVTTMNRREDVGRIDHLGRAYRFEPSRNAGFDEVDAGMNSLENNVGAIFQTPRPIHLERTTERRLAFEALDRDGDGLLQPEEISVHGDRLRDADRNADGVVDFGEFDALDVL
jgi:hypothetical protein